MSRNGIAWLPTKEARQLAKLQLAETKRQATGAGYRENRYLDIDLLPTKYSGNAVVNNPNVGGLVQGRPWKTTPNTVSGLWRTVYSGFWQGDPQWFNNVGSTSEGAVTDFSLAPYAGDEDTSFMWLGYFRAPHTANYTFTIDVDDLATFWLGDDAITNYTLDTSFLFADIGTSVSDPIALTAGQYYPIRVMFGNASGIGYFNFSWEDDYVGPFTTYEVVDPAGSVINAEQTAAFKLTIKSTSYNVEPFENAQIGINDLLTVDTSSRGHTVLRMEPDGTVIDQTTYDTWNDTTEGRAAEFAALNAALTGYATGTVIAICTYDACSLNAETRNTLNTYYGGTLTDTWDPGRYSHIFIGVKVSL